MSRVRKRKERKQGQTPRILEYATHSGFGNQVQALLAAVFIANVTDRTLNAPPLLPHDFIRITGARECYIRSGTRRQQAISDAQSVIRNPQDWDSFDGVFRIPTHYVVRKRACKAISSSVVAETTTCSNATCDRMISSFRSEKSSLLCLGALNDHHSSVLQRCQGTYPLAKSLLRFGLPPVHPLPLRSCTCTYRRMSDSLAVPGKMRYGTACPFRSINRVWTDQMCCASCKRLNSSSTSSSFWQQVTRLHRSLLVARSPT